MSIPVSKSGQIAFWQPTPKDAFLCQPTFPGVPCSQGVHSEPGNTHSRQEETVVHLTCHKALKHPKKMLLSWTPLPGKKECPLSSGEQWGSPCQKLRTRSRQSCSQPADILGWGKVHMSASKETEENSRDEEPPSQAIPSWDSWEGLWK